MLGEHSDSTSDVIQKAVQVNSLNTSKFFYPTELTLWRNGSASDSRSEGCVFESRQGQYAFLVFIVVSTFSHQIALAIHGEHIRNID